MTQTEKLGLVLPSADETYDINVFNENFRTIDKNIGGAEDLENLQTEDKTSLVNAINEVLQSTADDIAVVSQTVQGIATDVSTLNQGVQDVTADVSTLNQDVTADINAINQSLLSVTTDIAAIKESFQNVTAELSNMIHIKVLVDEAYIGYTVACTNGLGTQLRDVDSSLIVTFDVTFGEWQIILDDLEENVSVYYYGIHNVDLRPEPDSVALLTTMSSSTSGVGVVSASTELSDSSLAYEAVDGYNEQGYGWLSDSSGYPQWWQFQFYVSKVVKKFKFSSSGNAVKTFKLQGSNDGIEWTDLGTYVNTVTTSFTYVEYTVNNRKSYQYYRLFFMDGYTNYASIGEIQMYGYERL